MCGRYLCQIINKILDKDHMCASLCTSPTSLPHVRLRAGAKPYQQECWDCLVSSGDIMAGCQMQQGGLSASFLLVASATQSQAVDQRHPLPTVSVLHKLATIIDWTRTRSLLTHMSPGQSRILIGSIFGLKHL